MVVFKFYDKYGKELECPNIQGKNEQTSGAEHHKPP